MSRTGLNGPQAARRARMHLAILMNKNRTWIAACIGLAVVAVGVSLHAANVAPGAAQGNSGEAVSTHQAMVNQYCVTCHNDTLQTAGLALDRHGLEGVGQDGEVWERVVGKLRSGAMPPPGRPRPEPSVMKGFITWVESELDQVAARNPNPGRKVPHRLNRSEYTNAIRDLLALEIDGQALLPPDGQGYGFDNIADVLTVSPSLLERYISTAREVARLAVGDVTVQPTVDVYRTSKDRRHEDRSTEDMPFGTRGGITVRRHFPVDGEYSFKLRLLRTVGDQEYIRGFHRGSDVDVRIDGERVAQFRVGGELGCPLQGLVGSGCFQQISGADATIRDDEPDALEFRLPMKAGPRTIVVTFPAVTLQPEGVEPTYPTTHYTFQNSIYGLTFIDALEVGGPYRVTGPGNSPSRQRIFACQPVTARDEPGCAETILARLARLAYRRPLTGEDTRILMSFYESGRQDGGSFDAGIRSALVRMLVSPSFLFRAESDPPGGSAPGVPYRISDLALASRLSFFLWSSIPDDELLRLAERERLREPGVLRQQVDRMLADPRSEMLVRNFAGQWLLLRNLQAIRPDTHEFPDFDDELREAFQRETEMFFESQLREDQSVLQLLQADYTFLNERLARHYGIPNVFGSHFRRVTLTAEHAHRRGLLGQASVLTVTSLPNRTSPVARGKWVLENVLGAPPPAPPPDIPALEELPAVRFQSMRDRMEQHRGNPACASCHARIDPPGFALENFDGVGRWRSHQGETRIDASGSLDGHAFDGVDGLRAFLLEEHEEEFLTTVTKKLLTYAMGRGVEYYDMPAVREILGQAADRDYHWSAIISGIVKSVPFQMRRADS